MPHSQRFQELKKLIDPKKAYPLAEAVELVKKTSAAKFDATVELHCKLGINPTKGEEQVRGTVSLPHGTGKTKKVAAFVGGEKVKDAREAGADLVGGEDLIAEIAKTEKIDFDVAVAAPEMMPKLAKLAKILGPRGLMPNPKTETVGPNVKKMVEELKKGKIAFKNDATGNLHLAIGKVSFAAEKLAANAAAALEAIKKAKPASSKGDYFQNITLTSSMGPGVKAQAA
ncbi:50S ribosomal protein L1 [Patescibacteria group bacterium]|nr:MAG: 50S ribosomal protein L1 [Patescibacteria group bacterium]